jgi:hypothetical protein
LGSAASAIRKTTPKVIIHKPTGLIAGNRVSAAKADPLISRSKANAQHRLFT